MIKNIVSEKKKKLDMIIIHILSNYVTC